MSKIRYVVEFDGDKTTLQINDEPPLTLLTCGVELKRPPQVDHERSAELGWQVLKAGFVGSLEISATIDYTKQDDPEKGLTT